MLSAGTLVGPCEVVSWLGAGGMGEVCGARDVNLFNVVLNWFEELKRIVPLK